MLLSACMIVRDEAANIARCLVSVRSVASEIIVVDTGSKDGTREIAAAHGARVFDFKWCDDFAAARNFSISKAAGKWLMWVDADDYVPPDTIAAINGILPSWDRPRVIWLRLLNVNSINPDPDQTKEQIRIWPNGMGLVFRCNVNGRLHESIGQSYKVGSVAAHEKWKSLGLSICHHADGQPVLMDSEHRTESIHHLGYSDGEAVRQKIDRNIRLRMIGMGCDPSFEWVWFEVGKYRCVYCPNVLMIWDRLEPIAMGEPFTVGHVLDDFDSRREAIVSAAIDLCKRYEDSRTATSNPCRSTDAAIDELVNNIKRQLNPIAI